MAKQIVHYAVEALDRTSVCGRQAMRTTDEEHVTCPKCLAVIDRWYRQAESEHNALQSYRFDSEARAVGYGGTVRVW